MRINYNSGQWPPWPYAYMIRAGEGRNVSRRKCPYLNPNETSTYSDIAHQAVLFNPLCTKQIRGMSKLDKRHQTRYGKYNE